MNRVSRKPLTLWIVAGVFFVSLAIDIAAYRRFFPTFAAVRSDQTASDRVIAGTGELEPGILMALDENGLRSLAEKPPLEVRLTDENGNLASGRIHLGPRPTPQPKPGQILVLNGTKATSAETKILLKDGRLVDSPSAGVPDLDEIGAVKVVHIRITEGPQRNLEGWVRWDEVQSTPQYAPFR